jgi:hypothetical protein
MPSSSSGRIRMTMQALYTTRGSIARRDKNFDFCKAPDWKTRFANILSRMLCDVRGGIRVYSVADPPDARHQPGKPTTSSNTHRS